MSRKTVSQYFRQILQLLEFSKKLQPYTDWFSKAGIVLHPVKNLQSQYAAYLTAIETGTEEFQNFHRPEWFSLAKDGMLAAVLDHPNLELIQFHFHCKSTEGNNHYFGLCREPMQLLMLLETPYSPLAFGNAIDYLTWLYGYRNAPITKTDHIENYVFSASRLFQDPFDSRFSETNLRFLYCTYSYNRTTDLSTFKAHSSISKALTCMNYGIEWSPKYMRFTDNQQYLPEKNTLTVRELMAFLISKLPLQCVELVAWSARYPFGYLYIVSENFRHGKPEGVMINNEVAYNDLPVITSNEDVSFGMFTPQSPIKRLKADDLLSDTRKWSFTFAYPGPYIPSDFLVHFKDSPFQIRTLEEKHNDQNIYYQQSKIYVDDFEKEMNRLLTPNNNPFQGFFVCDGKEDEIY